MAKRSILSWSSLQQVAALALGVVGLSTGQVGLMGTGAVGGAALAGAWRELRARHGMDSARLLAGVRREVRAAFAAWAEGRPLDEADLAAADALIGRDLADCIPDDEAIAAAALSDLSYPHAVALRVVERLAERHAIFGVDGVEGASATARDFAILTVDAAMRAALADKDYVARLLPYMVAAVAGALKAVSDKATSILQEILATRADLGDLLEQVPDLALRREIILLVGSHPQASVTEIAGDVARFAREYRKLLDELTALKADDNQLRGAEEAAEAALRAGDLNLARTVLDEAVRTAELRAAAPARDLARVLDRKARAALLQRDWRSADAAWARAAAVLAPFDPRAEQDMIQTAAHALFDHSLDHGDTDALPHALSRWAGLAELAGVEGRNRDWVGHWNNAGNAAAVIAHRSKSDDGTALAAYRRALSGCSRETMPDLWVTTQNHIGAQLEGQAMRAADDEARALYAEAVATYRDALTIATHNSMPVEWSQTLTSLANTLQTQAKRERGAEGVALLKEAADLQRQAMTIRNRAERPREWASLNNNLANTLAELGERTEGDESDALLSEAAECYANALTVRTREEAPVQWATTLGNRSTMLRSRASRAPPPARRALLTEAIEGHRLSLAVRTERNMPVQWAMTLHNLGNALYDLAAIAAGAEKRALLDEVIRSYRSALTVRTQEDMPAQWKTTHESLEQAILAREACAGAP